MARKLTPKREWFDKQIPEHRLSILKLFLDLFTLAVSEKMKVLPTLSAISVALLIIATLNPDLMPIGMIPAKIIISVLLLIIPFSLITHILEMEKAARKALKYLGEYQRGIAEEFEGALKSNRWERFKIKFADSKFWDRFASEFPISVAIVYFVIVVYLLYVMWK